MSGAAPRAAPALAAAAEGCTPRGKLDPIYCDDNGDGIADLLRHIEKVTGKKVQYFGPQHYAAQLEAMRSVRLHVTGDSTGSVVWAVNVAGAVPFTQMATDKGGARLPHGRHRTSQRRQDQLGGRPQGQARGLRPGHLTFYHAPLLSDEVVAHALATVRLGRLLAPLHLIALATWTRTVLGRLVTFRSGGSYDEGPM